MRSHTLDLNRPQGITLLILAEKKEYMGRGYTFFARSWKRKNRRYGLRCVIVLALASVAAILIFAPEFKHADGPKQVSVETLTRPDFPPLSPQLPIPSVSDVNANASNRLVYPYSVIPGGIKSVAELKIAITEDPLVKAHYQGFDLTKAHIVRLTKDRAVHVSYRRGSRIYWTRQKLTLFEGETLISDGKNASRTRCGNRISDRPTPPFPPDEPPAVEFDTPVLTAVFTPPPPPLAPPSRGFLPIVPIVPIFSGGGSRPPAGDEPPAPVPEPGTLSLLIVTLPVVWLSQKKRCS